MGELQYKMNYLNQLKWHLQNTFRLENLPKPLNSSETLSRFISNPDHVRANGGLKPAAFSPHSTRRDLSVYRSSSCEEEKIWWLAEIFVDKKRQDKKVTIGRADFPSTVVNTVKIHINADGKPHLRHVNLERFADKESSDLQMQKLELANASTYLKRP